MEETQSPFLSYSPCAVSRKFVGYLASSVDWIHVQHVGSGDQLRTPGEEHLPGVSQSPSSDEFAWASSPTAFGGCLPSFRLRVLRPSATRYASVTWL